MICVRLKFSKVAEDANSKPEVSLRISHHIIPNIADLSSTSRLTALKFVPWSDCEQVSSF